MERERDCLPLNLLNSVTIPVFALLMPPEKKAVLMTKHL